MIDFRCGRVDKKNRNTPILKDSEIDDWAEILLQDYKPKLLKEPGPIKYLHFLETYLGATIEIHDIYYDEKDGPIWGATAFNRESLKVFDRENMCTERIQVNSRTVILDNSVMEDGNEGLALFTGLHEGGHLWLHPGVYTRCHQQIELFDITGIQTVVCCRRKQIENFSGKRSFMTGEDWREHQANYFASAVAMPKSTFIPFCRDFLKSQGINDGRVVTGVDRHQNQIALFDLPWRISEMYGVSMQAAAIKLKKFGFIVGKESLRQTIMV